MSKLRVNNFTISVDGYGAGPNQSLETPLGAGGEELHAWMVNTAAFKKMHGDEGGTEGVDNDITAMGDTGIGAWIMGRNMFGPIRGEWGDSDWSGWWGPNPPYHSDVYVLTHYPRPPLEMEGGTTFHFVTDGIQAALERAKESARGLDIRLLGGASTIQQYLRAGLVDEMHVAISPVVLGSGERLFDNLAGEMGGLTKVEFRSTPAALHAFFSRG